MVRFKLLFKRFLAVLFTLGAPMPVLANANANANANSTDPSFPSPAILKTLCSLIVPNPKLDYEGLFDESFRKSDDVTADLIVSVFNQIAAAGGSCTGLEDLSSLSKYTEAYRYAFRLERGSSALFMVRMNPQSGKIVGLLYSGFLLSPTQFTVTEARVPTRDGVKLRTLVFRKKDSQTNAIEKRAVVLTRTPYFNMNGRFDFASNFTTAAYFMDRGYDFVFQAVRGTAGSEGEPSLFNPIEIADGADTIRWITQQPFSNGKVAAVGTSYEGLTAAAAGVENPAGLEVIMAGAGPTDSSTGTFNRGGVLSLAALDYIRYFTRGENVPFTETLFSTLLTKAASVSDLRTYDELVFGSDLPEWNRWADAYADPSAPFWKERSFIKRLPEINVPTYHMAGLRTDGNMADTVNNFLEIERSSPYREKHHLVLGYWDHGNNTPYGDGSNMAPFLRERFDSLLAHYLKGETSPYVTEARVQVQSLASEKFREGSSYPLKPAQEKTLYFGVDQSGLRLHEAPVYDRPYSEYAVKPLATYAPNTGQDLAFSYQAQKDLLINGNVGFELYLQIDAPQTDLIIAISKLDRAGNEAFVTQCIPGQRLKQEDTIVFKSAYCPVLSTLKQGERLQILITSNLFPYIARNTNNDPSTFYSRTPREAKVRLLHGAAHPSRLTMELEVPEGTNVRPFRLPRIPRNNDMRFGQRFSQQKLNSVSKN